MTKIDEYVRRIFAAATNRHAPTVYPLWFWRCPQCDTTDGAPGWPTQAEAVNDSRRHMERQHGR